MNGEFLRKKIEMSGFQMVDVAEYLNISPQDLHSKLKTKDVKVSFLMRIAEALNKTVYYFLDDKNQTKSEVNVIKENDNINDNLFDYKPNVQERLSFVQEPAIEYAAVMKKIKFAENINLSENGAPYYPLPISAGQTEELVKEEEKPTGFISIPGVNCKAYFPVIGCSFEPLIRAGDIIGIDFINNWDVLDPDCLYYVITHDQRMLKRLMRHPTKEGTLLCISPNYKEFSIDISEIKTVHKVVFYGRLV